jgi:hypothetical protein
MRPSCAVPSYFSFLRKGGDCIVAVKRDSTGLWYCAREGRQESLGRHSQRSAEIRSLRLERSNRGPHNGVERRVAGLELSNLAGRPTPNRWNLRVDEASTTLRLGVRLEYPLRPLRAVRQTMSMPGFPT